MSALEYSQTSSRMLEIPLSFAICMVVTVQRWAKIPELRVFEMTKIITFCNSTNKFSFPISRDWDAGSPGIWD